MALVTAPAHAATPQQVLLRVYDRTGRRLDFARFRQLQQDGQGPRGDDDALLDPRTLTVEQGTPLYAAAGGDVTFDWPGQPVALSLAWPTSEGYSTWILDFKRPGSYNFTALAGEQALAALRAELATRPRYRRSHAFRTTLALATRLLSELRTSASDSRRGALGQLALDACAHAQTLLLSEYGVQRPQRGARWAVTFDRLADAAAIRSVQQLYGRGSWVRLVFDRSAAPVEYRSELAALHRAGLHALGELLDSSAAAHISPAQFRGRLKRFVAALPSVDEWEIGNEVNLRATSVTAREIAYAAAYVHRHTHARTLLTVFWQLGEDDPRYATLNWLAANHAALGEVDDIGVSLYPQQAPMGFALDRVLHALHAAQPRKRLLISELGYAIPDAPGGWWWGSPSAATGRARNAVARLYQSAILGYPFCSGGTFWWYYLEDALPSGSLWATLHDVRLTASRGSAT